MPGSLSSLTGAVGSTTLGSVSRTSPMRPADTAARGSRNAIIVAIITAMRIWMR